MYSPIIFSTDEDANLLNELENRIKGCEASKFLLSYPIVYLHYWDAGDTTYTDRKGIEHTFKKYDVYIGESNDIVSRTSEHYAASKDEKNWQYNLTHNRHIPKMIVVGHPHFNKSLTLDIENKLIEYLMASPKTVERLYNGRGNPQNGYYPSDEFGKIFDSIWRDLRKMKPDLFLKMTAIEQSALFKASPLKKLTPEQIDAKETILAKIHEALAGGKDGQLIFVQGEAGTGKTVLNSSIFYELVTRGKEYFGREIDCHLMVNHDQQITVYEQLAERLELGKDRVHKPTSFINKYADKPKVDVSFVDEGHLLLTQGRMSYQGKNQLEDIMERSRVTVVMFDEYQVLTADEYWEQEVLEKFKEIAHKQNNYIGLSQQLRMNCAQTTIDWINDFVLNKRISEFIMDSKYEVRSFDSPADLENAIREKASKDDSKLSRIVATYDWPYNKEKHPDTGNHWEVRIGHWHMPWNYETYNSLSGREKRQTRHQAWAEQAHTIDEVGSTFTIQGFDLNYVGVILGPSVKFRNNDIVFDSTASHNERAKQRRTLKDGSHKSFGDIFVRNEVKVLLTRGIDGLYIYACDKDLRNALRNTAKI